MSPTAENVIFTNALEQDTGDLPIQGTLPAYVRGNLYLNGPAGFDLGTEQRRHWLDGDGLVRQLSLDGNTAAFRSRYVQTQRFQDEQAVGKRIYRSFGTAFPGDQLINGMVLASPANVSVYPFGNHLLAFGEQSLPWLMDPNNLDTLGEMQGVTKMNRIGALSAHPKFDGDIMANFGIRFLGPRARLFYYECNTDLEPVRSGSTVLSGANLIHDFALSKRFALFHTGPYRLDTRQFMKKGAHLLDALSWHPEHPTELILFDRATAQEADRLTLPQTNFCLHLVNAFDNPDGSVTVDLIETDRPFYDQYIPAPHLFPDLQPCSAVRLRVTPGAKALDERIETPLGQHADFPAVANEDAQRPTDCFWALGMPSVPKRPPKFYNQLFRFDQHAGIADRWITSTGDYLGAEPVVITDPAQQTARTVACQCFNPVARTASWLFFNGWNLKAGPVARIDLPQFDPPGFHSAWLEATK